MEINAKNRVEPNDHACATHDYCDPNQAMLDAFVVVKGRDVVFFNDDEPESQEISAQDTALTNAAWSYAKHSEFFVKPVLSLYQFPSKP